MSISIRGKAAAPGMGWRLITLTDRRLQAIDRSDGSGHGDTLTIGARPCCDHCMAPAAKWRL